MSQKKCDVEKNYGVNFKEDVYLVRDWSEIFMLWREEVARSKEQDIDESCHDIGLSH